MLMLSNGTNVSIQQSEAVRENLFVQNTPQQMKAMAIDEFGGPDKLKLHTLPVPAVEAGEVLIRVEVAGGNIWDALEREGDLVYNEVHFPRVLGSDCAGTISVVGEGVERFAVGDRVGCRWSRVSQAVGCR
jgi:NADPH:quinone reductase